ncbi:hypothetical protein ACFVYR_10800 [Streptomyces sp. NPDC058284]|uniref:hypothetical protein n=1 Tax=unclassified Streptomyces TaxID=2593676 RepID=UPI0036526E70
MPSYHEVMTTELSALSTAAKKWDDMADSFKTLEGQYKRDVHGISLGGPTWRGQSAGAANERFDVTLREIRAAQTEAKAVASLLRDAHAQFSELKAAVKKARSQAVDAGMSVSDQGICRFDYKNATESQARAARNDPGLPELERSWSGHIRKAVEAVNEADRDVKLSLEAVVIDSDLGDGTLNGFNAHARKKIKDYEAEHEAEEAANTLTRINEGANPSAREIAALKRTFKEYSDNEVFSKTLLDSLGPSGTLTLSNRLNDLGHVKDPGHGSDYATLESGLANTLAKATQNTDTKWYKEWHAGLKKAGVSRYETDFHGARLEKVHGYQSLVTLMQAGTGDKANGFSSAFLKDVGNDIIGAEKKNPDIWDLKGTYSGKASGWFANDPLDGLLGVMSHDPVTATSFLNSDKHLGYLLGSGDGQHRDWNVIEEDHEGAKASTYTPALDSDNRAGFGAALQAAATGIDPSDENAKFVEHTEGNKKVFETSISHLSEKGDEFPTSLREPMAKILVNHGDTVHTAASTVKIADSPVSQHDLFEVIKQVSKSDDSYGELNHGINKSIVSDIYDEKLGKGERPEDSLTRAGRTIGFLEEARSQAADDPKTAEIKGKWIVDKGISYLPVGSEDVQAGFDYVADKWQKDEQARLDDKQADANVDAYKLRNGQLMALAKQWVQVHGGSKYDAQDTIDKSASAGADNAVGVSGE